jgi:hypothetical protein
LEHAALVVRVDEGKLARVPVVFVPVMAPEARSSAAKAV